MIYQAIRLISEQLNAYLQEEEAETQAVLGNIAMMDNNNTASGTGNNGNSLEDKLIVTLVNLQEEKVLKNLPAYAIRDANKVVYQNPPVILNLYLLFSATHLSYEKALVYLAYVIAFFQGKRVFDNRNTPIRADLTPQVKDMEAFRFIMDIYSPSFEEANYLWGTLGGKQYPHVLYRLRMTPVSRTQKRETRGVIEEIKIND